MQGAVTDAVSHQYNTKGVLCQKDAHIVQPMMHLLCPGASLYLCPLNTASQCHPNVGLGQKKTNYKPRERSPTQCAKILKLVLLAMNSTILALVETNMEPLPQVKTPLQRPYSYFTGQVCCTRNFRFPISPRFWGCIPHALKPTFGQFHCCTCGACNRAAAQEARWVAKRDGEEKARGKGAGPPPRTGGGGWRRRWTRGKEGRGQVNVGGLGGWELGAP